jgi:hypothetical protein
MRRRLLVAVTALAIAAACLDPIHGSDLEPADVGPDAAAEGLDASQDASLTLDAGMDGSIVGDAAMMLDVGPDAAVGEDAAVPGADAALPDAAAPFDSGGWDVGTPDVGGPEDAASPIDAGSPGDASCASGHLFDLDYASGNLRQDLCLQEITRFKAGPCSGDGGCHLYSRSVYPTPDGGMIESVVVGSKLWSYDAYSGAPIAGAQNVDLNSFPYLTAALTGVCYGKNLGECVLDTRVLWVNGLGSLVETITARSGLWDYDGNTHASLDAIPGNDLTLVPRYSVVGGPCFSMASGQCHFQTQAFVKGGDGRMLELDTSAGKLWIFDDTGTAQLSGAALGSVSRYAQTACAGVDGGCGLRTHTLFSLPDGGTLESFSN